MKRYLIIPLCLLVLSATSLYAATTDFIADADITISAVKGIGVQANFTILNGSRAESWTFANNGAFTVTNPDSTNPFKVTSTAQAIHLDNSSGTEVNCVGSGATLTLPSTAGTYTIYSSDSACSSGSSSSGGGSSGGGGGGGTPPPPLPPPPVPSPVIPSVLEPVPVPSSLKELRLQLLTTQLKLLLQLLVSQLQAQLQARVEAVTPVVPLPVPPSVAPAKQLQLKLMTTQLKLLKILLQSRARAGAIGQ